MERTQRPILILTTIVLLGSGLAALTNRSSFGASATTPDLTPFVCPVTFPNGLTPPGEDPSSGHYGNGKLWTALWPFGVVMIQPEFVEPDGSLGMKFAWWRDVEGPLEIEGQRLDAPAPPLRWHTPSGNDGRGERAFIATGLFFPTEGCWEVTGRAGEASLTFVTLVVLTEEALLQRAQATPTVAP